LFKQNMLRCIFHKFRDGYRIYVMCENWKTYVIYDLYSSIIDEERTEEITTNHVGVLYLIKYDLDLHKL
jgi:hypothetical protein